MGLITDSHNVLESFLSCVRRKASSRWPFRWNLTLLAKEYGTDKWGIHRYTPHYQRHFCGLRNKRINLLEIGVGGHDNPNKGGASLRMWKAYFTKGHIYAIDIFDKSKLQEPRITLFRGSQNDPEFLQWVARKVGRLDIVIDDGSHVNEHVLTSFNTLFPLLDTSGIYAIEDIGTSYWEEFGGTEDPMATHTSAGLVRSLIDSVNWEEFRCNPPALKQQIVSLHCYHNLAIIHKGDKEEGSNKHLRHMVHK